MLRAFRIRPVRIFQLVLLGVGLLGLGLGAAPAQNTGKLTLNGDLDYAKTDDNDTLSVTGQALTVEVWIKHDGESGANARIIDKGDGDREDGSIDGYELYLQGSGEEVPVTFTIGDSNGALVTSQVGVPAGEWTHVAGTYDGNNLSIYINGELAGQTGESSNINDGTTGLFLGTNESENEKFFSGTLDEVRIWDQTRSQLEIQNNMYSEMDGTESGLVTYYPFGYGNPDSDESGTSKLSFLGDYSNGGPDAFPVPVNQFVEDEGAGQVELSWEERGSNSADEFWLYEAPANTGASFTKIKELSSGTTSHTVTDLNNAQTYYYRIKRVTDDTSDFSPTAVATPYIQEGGSSLHLDGDLDYGMLSDRPSLDETGTTITVEAWIKHDGESDGNARIIDKGDGDREDGSIDGYELYLQGSGEEVPVTFTFGDSNGATVTSKAGVPAGKWTHVAATYDGNNMSIYINGELEGQTSESSEINDGNTGLYLGTNESTNQKFFSGHLDEVAVWATARTQAEIQNTYQTELSGAEDSLEAYWRFNDFGKEVSTDISGDFTHRRADAQLKGDASVTRPGVFPMAPTIYGRAGNKEAELAWSPRRPGEVAEYTVYQAESPEGSNRSMVTEATQGDTSHTDPNLTNGANLFYQATVKNAQMQESDYGHPLPLTPAAAERGRALTLDGDLDYGTVTDRPSLDVTGTSLTVEAWIKHDGGSDGNARIIDKGEGDREEGSIDGYELYLDGSGDAVPVTFTIGDSNGATVTSDTSIPKGSWAHVAATYDGNEIRIYVNGELEGTTSEGSSINNGNTDLYFGTTESADERFFSGKIDEVRIWSLARTQTQIQNSYQKELIGNQNTLLGYWRFNEAGSPSVSRAAAGRPKTVTLSGDATTTKAVPTDIRDPEEAEELPESYALRANYPNPFNPSTTIRYELPEASQVTLRVYDALGREVRTLVDERQGAGVKTVEFDASGLPSGAYFYRMRAGSFVEIHSMMIAK